MDVFKIYSELLSSNKYSVESLYMDSFGAFYSENKFFLFVKSWIFYLNSESLIMLNLKSPVSFPGTYLNPTGLTIPPPTAKILGAYAVSKWIS